MKETRIFAAPVEAREGQDGAATIAGYASVFNSEYEVAGMFTESVDPRAFNKTLSERDGLAVVWSHDADRVLGTVRSNTARFDVDEHGLRYEADLDLLDPDGISAWRKITTGKVDRSSFSFEVVKDKWEDRDGGLPHRQLVEVKLWEASPVLWPASSATEVDVKRAVTSYAEYRGASPDAESIEQVRKATTPEPEVEPPQALGATQVEPEPRLYPRL